MKLIDANALKEKIVDNSYLIYDYKFNSVESGMNLTGIQQAIGEMPKVEQSRWIPCSERLPEKWGDYLVTSKWKGVGSGTVYIETNMAVYNKRAGKWDHPDVIAWMPLPEPYEEEK